MGSRHLVAGIQPSVFDWDETPQEKKVTVLDMKKDLFDGESMMDPFLVDSRPTVRRDRQEGTIGASVEAVAGTGDTEGAVAPRVHSIARETVDVAIDIATDIANAVANAVAAAGIVEADRET